MFPRIHFFLLGALCLFLPAVLPANAAGPPGDLPECRRLFVSGDYSNCIRVAEEAIRNRERGEDWPLLLTRALNAVGRYAQARAAVSNALLRYPISIRLRLAAHDTYLRNGQQERAFSYLDEINELGGSRAWAYQDPPNLIALGQAALLLGAEPRRVLELFYDRALKSDPDNREGYLATGALGLEKEDYEVAAKAYRDGLKKIPNDPDLHYGLARAYAGSDRPQMAEEIDEVLQANTNHVGAMHLMIDHLIDAEQYSAARKLLRRALAVNPVEPDTWAYTAVIDHLEGDGDGETRSRETGLSNWPTNPRVDHLIGKKLSQKYRFAEGAARQRKALEFDPEFLPAQIQLAQDLLRLGKESEGWALAKAVYEKDAYNVSAYNLVTLEDNISHFATLTNADFIVRMDPREAAIYGARVQNLLTRAKQVLSKKYGHELPEPVLVEIFADQKDFAIRTFGMPGGEGFLGVCFGPVITANSPASQALKNSNWEAILWHEFCHVITLGLTKNRMPRWLSEGISVYEEERANRAWGQKMTPRYRDMILTGELVPIRDLSAAFLSPKSDFHLQFAYFESAMVVGFLLERFGVDSFRKLLDELSTGRDINDALEKTTRPLPELEREFAASARGAAEALAPGLDWTKPEGNAPVRRGARAASGSKTNRLSFLDELLLKSPQETKTNAPEHKPTPAATNAPGVGIFVVPSIASTNRSAAPLPEQAGKPNFYKLTTEIKELLEQKAWEKAKEPLAKLIKLYPEQTGPNSGYSLLAEVHRNLGETNLEKECLQKLAVLDAESPETYARLMQINRGETNWVMVAENAERFLAVNPLSPLPYRYLAESQEEIQKNDRAVEAWRALLALDPADVSQAHYRLARLLKESNPGEARQHVLRALEESPRFREAHRLLLELNRDQPAPAGRISP